MKSPEELARKLARQWENTTLREARLLDEPDAWPITLSIGKPSPAAVRDRIGEVREHFETWRSVTCGEVAWRDANYRSTLEAVSYPAEWILPDTETWIGACRDRAIAREFQTLSDFLPVADPRFHELLVRRRALWRDRDPADVKQSLRLALQLEPGCADGLPLRSLPIIGNDTKFFERNEHLLLALLDVRFEGEATRQGLEPFLGAHSDAGHWLLVTDIDGSLLPFRQIRVRAAELKDRPLPGESLLIVENESCQHHLPELPDTIAVSGTGFDLAWTAADWLRYRRVAYWGDLDTWGLDLLGRARANCNGLAPLLMTRKISEAHQRHAVPEKTPAPSPPHFALTDEEARLFHHLRYLPDGRLEQEFLPIELVRRELLDWLGE